MDNKIKQNKNVNIIHVNNCNTSFNISTSYMINFYTDNVNGSLFNRNIKISIT